MYSKGTLLYAHFGKQSVSGLLIANPVHMPQVQGEAIEVCETNGNPALHLSLAFPTEGRLHSNKPSIHAGLGLGTTAT